MKKLLALVVLAGLLGGGAFAQQGPATRLPGGNVGGADPQFALSILTEYFEKDERSDRKGGAVLTGIGTVMFSAGLAGTL